MWVENLLKGEIQQNTITATLQNKAVNGQSSYSHGHHCDNPIMCVKETKGNLACAAGEIKKKKVNVSKIKTKKILPQKNVPPMPSGQSLSSLKLDPLLNIKATLCNTLGWQ